MIRALFDSARQDPQILMSVVPQFQARSHKKGDTLLHQGSVWDKAFFVERGMIRMHMTGRNGRDFNTSFWAEESMVLPITADMQERPCASTFRRWKTALCGMHR